MAAAATRTPTPTTDKPPRPRRWIPLSLRMFVVALVLVGVGSVLWVGIPAYRHHVAAREIEACNGFLWLYGRPPDWRTRLIGDELMDNFTEIYAVLGNVPYPYEEKK